MCEYDSPFDINRYKWYNKILKMTDNYTGDDTKVIKWFYSEQNEGVGKSMLGEWIGNNIPNWIYLDLPYEYNEVTICDMIKSSQLATNLIRGIIIDLPRLADHTLTLYRILGQLINGQLLDIVIAHPIHIIILANCTPRLLIMDNNESMTTLPCDMFRIWRIITNESLRLIDNRKLIDHQYNLLHRLTRTLDADIYTNIIESLL